MATLSTNWITEGLIDLEYKKYLLLAYLKEVDQNFNAQKLYPFLAELVEHHRNLSSLKEQKSLLAERFPKEMTRVDWQKLQLEFERLVHDDRHMEELEAIIDYALPKFRAYLKDGTEIYEFVEEHTLIMPVGVVPVNAIEGYLLVRALQKSAIDVYAYGMALFEHAHEKYRSLKTSYVTTYTLSMTNTYQSIKYDLIKSRKELPNPATYAVESKYAFPFEETLYPVAKRLLMKELST